MSHKRSLVPILGVILVVCIGIVLMQQWRSDSEVVFPERVGNPQSAEVGTPRTSASEEALAGVSRVSLSSIDISVLDDQTGEPIPQARAFALPGPQVRLVSSQVELLDVADEDGRISLDRSQLGSVVGVGADGYVAHPLTLDRMGSHVLLLSRGFEFTVSIRESDGSPLKYAVAAMSSLPLTIKDSYDEDCFGNPACEAPLWIAVSDGEGVSRFSGLPSGTYWLRVDGDELCPDLVVDRVSIPAEPIVIYLHELHGIIVKSIVDSPFSSHKFLYDYAEIVQSGCVLAQGRLARERLQELYPEALIFVGLPKNPPRAMPIAVTATQEDGSRGRISSVLQPISELLSPVYLEMEPSGGTGEVRVTIVCDGEELPGRRITLGATDGGDLHRTRSGETLRVPVGEYAVGPHGSMYLAWGRAFKDHRVEVVKDELATLTIEVPIRLRSVRVTSSYDHPLDDPPRITVGFTHQPRDGEEPGGSGAHANWLPGHQPVVFWLPDGRFLIDASAPGYEVAETTIELTKENERDEIAVELILTRKKE